MICKNTIIYIVCWEHAEDDEALGLLREYVGLLVVAATL